MATTSPVDVTAAVRDGDPGLTNKDLAPTPVDQRRWTWWHYATLWMGMVHNVFNFTWMGGLIAIGFSAWQAFLIAAAGTLIQTVVIGFNGRVGSRFGIPFPVWARSAFGTRGANIPALLRGAVAVGWFGVQSYLAALAVNLLFATVIPGWRSLGQHVFLGASAGLWIAMVVYWLLNFIVLRHGMETIRRFEAWAGPLIFVLVGAMLVWMLVSAHGVGPLFSQPAHFGTANFFGTKFVPALALFISGSWSTMCLNIPDLTRFARSNREQFWGTMIGLPLASLVYYAMAAMIVSAGIELFKKALWNPADVLTAINIPALSVIGALVLALATISVNIPSNIVSPAYDLNNLLPRFFTFKRAAAVAIVLSFLYGPWILMKNPATIYSVLDNIGIALGPITGIVMADFFVIRRRRLQLSELYRVAGAYRASGGYNLLGICVFLVGSGMLIAGEKVPQISVLYNNAWLVGVLFGFLAYTAGAMLFRVLKAPSALQFLPAGSEGSERGAGAPVNGSR